MSAAHGGLTPSSWVVRWARLLPAGAHVLDLACGSGRHVRHLAQLGHRVVAPDRDAAALEPLRAIAEVRVADLEGGPWPLAADERFDAVVVTNYLWRPLLPAIADAVGPGGLLVYETFALGNASVGKPSNPDFLLAPGDLLEAVRGRLRVLGYEDGFVDAPMRFVQRIAAVRAAAAPADAPARYPL